MMWHIWKEMTRRRRIWWIVVRKSGHHQCCKWIVQHIRAIWLTLLACGVSCLLTSFVRHSSRSSDGCNLDLVLDKVISMKPYLWLLQGSQGCRDSPKNHWKGLEILTLHLRLIFLYTPSWVKVGSCGIVISNIHSNQLISNQIHANAIIQMLLL